jgi:DNA (cytosine-5)-methyltransferase 1
MKRIAKGIKKFVIDNPKPFIVRIGQTGFGKDNLSWHIDQPLSTVTSKAEHLLVSPFISRVFGASVGHEASKPLATVTAGGGGKSQLVEASFIAKHYTGATGSEIKKPLSTITSIDHNALVTSHMIKFRGDNPGNKTDEPVAPISAGGNHIVEVRAFMLKYYGTNIGHDLNDPVQTVTTKDRFGLVTVHGQLYQLIDIQMRMLQPHELFAAQGFPKDYKIKHDTKGNKLSKSNQVARCGNAVCPPVAQALVAANS